MMRRLRRDERGVSAVVVSVCLIALMGAVMLSVDAGSLWTSRRTIITATDAAVLDAAQYFNSGADPCDSLAVSAAEQHATNVLTQNHPGALHSATDTPNGFGVTPTLPCGTPGLYNPGKVRFDGRIPVNRTISGLFGFDNLRAFSSSTAAWGYVTGLGNGLRPIAVCDQSFLAANPINPAPDAPDYPHYHLWRALQNGSITQATYDSFWGSDDVGSNDAEYPKSSNGYANGAAAHNPNKNRTYVNPATDSSFHTVHRIKMPDSRCGVSPGNLAWVDLTGVTGGTIGASTLKSWIESGYPGTVRLTPHDCNPADSVPVPENCGARPGDVSSVDQALGNITCPRLTPAKSCPVIFPVLVISSIVANGSNAEYVQASFLYVVMRGYSDIGANNMEFDFEFMKVQPSGEIGPANPAPGDVTLTGVQLCGVDNDPAGADHCPF